MIRTQPSKDKSSVKVTFSLESETYDQPVSVVGDFNEWSPFAHVMRKRSNGTRSASVTVPAGSHVHFRYLGSDGHWFDDPEADGVSDGGSVLTV